MAEHNDLGKKGEELAVKYLSGQGYRILDTNWRAGSLELDIVARDGEFLVVVEVKTRQSDFFGEPEVAVDRQKQKLIIRAANIYILRKNITSETRFDIISIVIDQDQPRIHHIKDAFYPMMR